MTRLRAAISIRLPNAERLCQGLCLVGQGAAGHRADAPHASVFSGMQDFRAFTDDDPTQKSTAVLIEAVEIAEDGDLLLVASRGRTSCGRCTPLVGVLVEAGRRVSRRRGSRIPEWPLRRPARLTARRQGCFSNACFTKATRAGSPPRRDSSRLSAIATDPSNCTEKCGCFPMMSSSGLQSGPVAAETISVHTNGSPLVLVLDDEENVRRSMCTYLERHAYEALEASTVEGALQIMRSRSVAAVIFDVRLAGSARVSKP